MRRLLLVSNRLPITIEKRKHSFNYRQSVGGLATGLKSVCEHNNGLWIGWCGHSSNSLDTQMRKDIESSLMEQFSCIPTFLTKRDVRLFYSFFCNRTLWPLFHYFAEFAVYDKESWETYKHVNRLFSQVVLKIVQPDDVIWIHDYHLMMLPKLLREKCPHIQIGFFLHIPFPSYELFRLLPWRKEILDGLLGADLIGFHTYDYVRHFTSSVRQLLGYEHALGQITVDHRLIKVDAFPMGIDYNRFADAKIDRVWPIEILKHSDRDKDYRIILSVDRLDYTKGIPQRLEAFDLFLEKYPEYKKKVTLVMVAVPSRLGVETYQQLKHQVDEWVGRINGKHGTIDWMPVWYLYRFLPFEKIVSLYDMADVALVTPLRDGMNLIAKEYIATRKDGRGVLILSEMAGAMRELAEAIIVNPNNKQEIADSLKEALIMTEEEQIERNMIMKERLQRYNVIAWAKDFMATLSMVRIRQQEIGTKKLSNEGQERVFHAYRKSSKRLLFLDYDGTLVPFIDKPEKAIPDDTLIGLLQALINDDKNEVVIISGRDKDTLDNWFGRLDLGLVAEHGAWIKIDRKTWTIVEPMNDEWMDEFQSILELFVDKTPGSFIEKKSYSLVWHYRKVDPELGSVRARELVEDLLHLTTNLNLMVLEGGKVIEIKSGAINKGRAAMHWIARKEWDFILAIGGDWTDEDLFEILPESAYTIKVGSDRSKAKFYVTNYLDIGELLQGLVNL